MNKERRKEISRHWLRLHGEKRELCELCRNEVVEILKEDLNISSGTFFRFDNKKLKRRMPSWNNRFVGIHYNEYEGNKEDQDYEGFFLNGRIYEVVLWQANDAGASPIQTYEDSWETWYNLYEYLRLERKQS